MTSPRFPRLDLTTLSETEAVDLRAVFLQLEALYDMVDTYVALTTHDLALPCEEGCGACCKECVFLTPLEFLYVWDWAQRHLDDATLGQIITRGLALYQAHEAQIDAFEQAPPEGESDHFSIARTLRFACPLLDSGDRCMVYPARELYSRLFGCSFQPDGGVYGCERVQQQLEGQELTLLPARETARHLQALPLTDKRQVYPFYIHALYGAETNEATSPTKARK